MNNYINFNHTFLRIAIEIINDRTFACNGKLHTKNHTS